MVGTNTKNIADVMKEYVGKPFLRGGRSIKGYDCIGFVYCYCLDIGAEFPTEYGDWDINNYHELYTRDEREAEDIMCRCFAGIGDEVAPQKVIAGDLVIVRHQNGRLFPGIFVGNNQVMASFIKSGVRPISIDAKNKIYMARRLITCPR